MKSSVSKSKRKEEMDVNATTVGTEAQMTQQERDEAMKKLVAIVEVDYGLGSEARWLGFAYETGLLRIKFPSGDRFEAQDANADSAIKGMREIAVRVGGMTERVFGFCDPRIEVHRVPAYGKGQDGLNKNILDWLTSIGLDCETHTMEAA